MTALMKRFGGRWVPDRRCWRVIPARARASTADILAAVEECLLQSAPPEWRESLPRISKIACATSRYEMKVGAGGIRLGLPPGHESRWALREVPGSKDEGELWLVRARYCTLPPTKPITAPGASD